MEFNYISLFKIFLAIILIHNTYCKVYHKDGVDKTFYFVKFSEDFNDDDSMVFYYQYSPIADSMLKPTGTNKKVNNEEYILSKTHTAQTNALETVWGQPADSDFLKRMYSNLIPDANSYGSKSYVAYKMEKICATDNGNQHLLYKFHLKYFECETEARYFYTSLINYEATNIAVRWSIKDNKFVESNGIINTLVGSYPYYPDEVLMGNNTPDSCQVIEDTKGDDAGGDQMH